MGVKKIIWLLVLFRWSVQTEVQSPHPFPRALLIHHVFPFFLVAGPMEPWWLKDMRIAEEGNSARDLR